MIGSEHIGFEYPNPVDCGDLRQLTDKHRAEAASLIIVGDRECGVRVVISNRGINRVTDNSLFSTGQRNQSKCANVVNADLAAGFGGEKFVLNDGKEAKPS